MNTSIDLSSLSERRPDGSSAITLALEGINCGGCVSKIENGLAKLPGIDAARVNFTDRRLSVHWRERDLPAGELIEQIEKLGFRAYPIVKTDSEEKNRQSAWLLRCLAVAGFAAMNIMLLSVSVWSGNATDITQETRDLFHWLSALIALPAAAYAGQPFFLSAFRALRARSVNMDVPISLGVALALGMSIVETALHAKHAYFDSAIMLLFFLLVGRYLDEAARRKTSSMAANLSALRADAASRIDENRITVVPLNALKPSDLVLVGPGEKIPADGIVINGRSEIDVSAVTGETARRRIAVGGQVYSGSMNHEGTLTVRVTAAGENSFLANVERLLAAAADRKSRYVQLADRVARMYAPVVHATAAITLAGWLVAGASIHDAIITAIAVLIITCPCALALAIPAVQVVASGSLFRAGILLHSGDALERMASVDTVIFDKTGTLTLPEARVSVAGIDPVLVETAARLALASRHPLAKALAREAQTRLPFPCITEETGKGIRTLVDGIETRLGSLDFCSLSPAMQDDAGASSLLGFRHGDRTCIFRIRQVVRPDAKEVADGLRTRGLKLVILSGDHPDAVRECAEALDVTDWHALVKPADKIAFIEMLKSTGHRVMMVGDGLNDAPALAAATVSMSPITASDLAQAQADAVFLGDRLMPVMDSITLASRASKLMQQNLALAVIYNLIAIPLAVSGLVTPLIAALAMSGSSILVTLNAIRAGYRRRKNNPGSIRETSEPAIELTQTVRS